MPVWCDGDPSSFIQLYSDLDSVQNQLWINSVYPYDGTTRILGSAFRASPDSLYLSANYPVQWSQKVIAFKIFGNNYNVGWSVGSAPEITIYASYKYLDTDGKERMRLGTGVMQYPYPDPDSTGKIVVPKPEVIPLEPLAITLSMESPAFVRDGVHSPTIVADITWKGQAITSKFTKNNSELNPTTYDYPFPDVTFEAGICLRRNVNGDGTYPLDHRGPTTSCFLIGDNPDISLSAYASTVSLSRTNIQTTSISDSHTHSCVIDSNGSGITDGTINISGSIADHVHSFSNYISDDVLSHTHTLRSVALVNLNPTLNPLVDIAINAYVVYDPTGCIPHVPSGVELSKPSTFLSGNRMMFNTIYIEPTDILNRKLVLTIDASPEAYSAENVTDTDRGFNIVATAEFSEYIVKDSDGNWITIPSQPVPDGTRVVFNINAYKSPLTPEEQEAESKNQGAIVIRPDTVRKYMSIKIEGTVISDGLKGEEENNVIVLSNLTWIPSVQGLLPELTDDSIYISDAISRIVTIGSSQIHDAVKLAAQRIIDYQTDNTSWSSAKKVVFLLTDGDENTSENSIDQAISEINIIDGKCEVPVIPVRLGYSYSSDDVLLGRYSKETCGQNYYLINGSMETQQDVIDDIITGGSIQINDGVFTNTIDLARDNLFSSVSLESLSIPSGARVLFRYRLSSDAKSWSDWSEWYDSSITKDFDLNLQFKARYFQYQIHLYGNENFETPELNAGMTSYYYKAQTFTVFFQPVGLDINTDEYLASIHITHKGNIPSTSVINYGCAQFNTINIEDYSQTTRSLVTPDRHSIMLTRYNEMFLPYNLLSYTAINGGWPDQAFFDIYRVNNSYPEGVLVDPSEYAANNKNGRITFYNVQRTEDKFVLCVAFDPEFRILCNVVNYGPEAIIIDHIGILYNVSKRIPRNSKGIIIHTPISERL